MTVIGIDDTDSRETGMCTTYAAATLADRVVAAGGSVDRTILVRLNPAVEYKTRGNAALAVHCDLDADTARDLAEETLSMAETDDPRTNPGAVVADCAPDEVPNRVAEHSRRAIRELLSIDDARALVDEAGFDAVAVGNGRGLVGALAAVGAWRAFDDWTYECISYRERERWGTERRVDDASLFAAADEFYPRAWDTVDHGEGYAVCVPRTPCPILHGIRGDDPTAVRAVADAVEGEPVTRRHLFRTNQGTDAHLQDGTVADVDEGTGSRVDGTVTTDPETREGGHVFVQISDGTATLECAAFEPTKRFRDRVRALRVGDHITAAGEVSDGTLKLEKFAARELVTTERVSPICPDCGRSMKSAGRDQGYRCRDCGTARAEKAQRDVERQIEPGWYEVPPCARRHIAKPLVRGGFDAPTHPER